jgi:hypothetical protein
MKYKLFVISKYFKKDDKIYFENRAKLFYEGTRIPRYPVYKKDGTIVMNKFQRSIINSLKPKTMKQVNFLIKYLFGAIIASADFDISKLEYTFMNRYFTYKIPYGVVGPSRLYHGWYSSNTRLALEGAIQLYKPNVIVELGVWMGASAIGVCETVKDRKIKFIGFDFFTDSADNPTYISKSPIENLLIDHTRLETTIANLSPYANKHDLFICKRDVIDSLGILKKNKIKPDLLFIDSIKETRELQTVIKTYLKEYPDIVIVGDDLVFDTVKKAIHNIPHLNFNQAYVIAQKFYPKSDFKKGDYELDKIIKRFELSEEEKKLVPKNFLMYL